MAGRHGPGLCGCGNQALGCSPVEATSATVEDGLIRAVFPDSVLRRRVLRGVGAGTLLAALGDLLPLGDLHALAQERGTPEKRTLKAGFLPLTCAAPLVIGHERGIYAKHGIALDLVKVPGIALIRDRMLAGELDISQQVMPVALSTTAGVGGAVIPTKVLTVLNQNGNALVLASRHRENRDPRSWRGFRFAVPFEQSHQNLQLRAYVANAGLDPDRDIAIRVTPPSEYVSQLRVGSVDGFFGGEPGPQRAVYEGVGFIHALSKEIWDGHPCCSITATSAWIQQHPNTFLAAFRGAVEAGVHCADPASRPGMAPILARAEYVNAPEVVLNQVLTGRYADGLGQVRTAADRVTYNPFPDYAMAVWLTVQMQRWNMLSGTTDAKALAREVMLATDAQRLLREAGAAAPEPGFGRLTVLGRPFDSSDPEGELRAARRG
ncbi:CmpA/NrtA family ABC transporter substrate-binding protein [Sabulicella glaciei]|uniref:ABC transporter substrate-binding protein n=1 Tax=Sabulicella glaciei TaxID=2984948 RepID=A0ABT3NZ26_9PROT|nr:CmpA/NrtA family ABC transporter substrate-binding protein [Roseococcus sp. MDT2-1-1]MCW8087404.1 ABC transporter substrate-binding protein [Roseococcus sp. MDT2-1-1]